jgi:hypothetical protein
VGQEGAGSGAVARPARYGPESGAARRADRDDGRSPRGSGRGRGEGFAGRRLGRGGLGRAFGLGPSRIGSFFFFVFLKYFPVQR